MTRERPGRKVNVFAAAILAALALGGPRTPRPQRRRRARLAPPGKCPVHGEAAWHNRYGKARYGCGCLWKHAHLTRAD